MATKIIRVVTTDISTEKYTVGWSVTVIYLRRYSYQPMKDEVYVGSIEYHINDDGKPISILCHGDAVPEWSWKKGVLQFRGKPKQFDAYESFRSRRKNVPKIYTQGSKERVCQ